MKRAALSRLSAHCPPGTTTLLPLLSAALPRMMRRAMQWEIRSRLNGYRIFGTMVQVKCGRFLYIQKLQSLNQIFYIRVQPTPLHPL